MFVIPVRFIHRLFFKDTRGTVSAHIIDFANKILYFDGTFHWKIINCSIRLTVPWDGNVSYCLDGEIDLDGFLWFLNSYWERAQNQMPHLCSSLSHQGFSSCREWRRCLKPVWNYSNAKHGEQTPVGPWPLCCPQWLVPPGSCDPGSAAQVEGIVSIQAVQGPWAG